MFGRNLDLAADAHLLGNPAPLGKVAGIIERRFLHARPGQAAFKLVIGQLAGVLNLPCVAVRLCAIRQGDRVEPSC